MVLRKNEMVANSRRLSVRGYLKTAFGVDKEEEVIVLMNGLLGEISKLGQMILKEYAKLNNFCNNSQS